MSEAQDYLNEVKARLATSVAIAAFEVVAERILTDRGYFRARLTLANGDFLEISEYFVIMAGRPSTQEYRYHQFQVSRRDGIRVV